jgi:hypothetical protein
MTAAPSFVETVPKFAAPVGSRKSNRTGRLVRIEQLQDAHLRDGVVRNLPASPAPAALHPVVALAQAGLDCQEDLDHGGIGREDVFALPELTCGRRIGEFWSYPQSRTFAELQIDCEEDRTLRAVFVGMLREMKR